MHVNESASFFPFFVPLSL